jgi:hypothetical protein
MAPRLLLVHSPLVGRETWEPVAAELAGRGWPVAVPDLTGTIPAGPPYAVRQAEVIARSAAGQPAVLAGQPRVLTGQPTVLIGHSGAGPLLAAAGARIDQVSGYIFVDAGLPIPGQTWLETVPAELAAQVREMADGQGWLPPWPQWWGDEVMAELIADPGARQRFAAGCPRLPLAMFTEVHPPAPRWPSAPGAYLQLSDGYDDEAARARELGWPVTKQISHHLAMLTEPGPITAALLEVLGQLGE